MTGNEPPMLIEGDVSPLRFRVKRMSGINKGQEISVHDFATLEEAMELVRRRKDWLCQVWHGGTKVWPEDKNPAASGGGIDGGG